jgi:hypothetical protein
VENRRICTWGRVSGSRGKEEDLWVNSERDSIGESKELIRLEEEIRAIL